MSIDDNKQVVQRYFDALTSGDEQAILNLLTDDFMFKSMPRHPEWLRYRWNREEFAAVPRLMADQMKKPLDMKLLCLTAEDDRVCAEAESYGELTNGRTYDNAYHFIFELRDGKIREVREYSCSYTAADVFGNFEENFEGDK
ncbi:MAG: hypothetical protein CMK32_13655 [Porticoccaceae bacterium]|nr:hypothetical protein [Porticoccaceae bacterium]